MPLYVVKYGETIGDLCLNGCGSLVAWSEILLLNEFTDWTPALVAGQIVEIPDVVEPFYAAELQNFPAANHCGTDTLAAQLTAFKALLATATPAVFALPVNYTSVQTYTVKHGETITDVLLNATGTIKNWNRVLDANNFTTWEPTLTAGQVLTIEADETQLNTFTGLQIYPAANWPAITNLAAQIATLIDKLTPPTKLFEDGHVFDFEDGIEYKFDANG